MIIGFLRHRVVGYVHTNTWNFEIRNIMNIHTQNLSTYTEVILDISVFQVPLSVIMNTDKDGPCICNLVLKETY